MNVSSGWFFTAWFLAAFGLVWLHARILLPRQPEPASDVPGASEKIPYRRVASWRFTAICWALSVLCAPLTRATPSELLPVWLVWSSSAVVLIVIDARTTWIPKRLTWLCLAEIGVALIFGALLSGRPMLLVQAGLSAAAFGVFFWLCWRIGTGIGFADVRLALGLGAVTGAMSAQFALNALLAASIIGTLWALVHCVRRGKNSPFAYAPAMWSGSWFAQITALVGR